MITILHGGGSLGTPKSDYVICARPLNKVVDDFKGSPHLVLVAARDINCGEEITVDYGVSNILSWSPI